MTSLPSPSHLLKRLLRSRQLPIHRSARRPGIHERLQTAVMESLEPRTLLSVTPHLVFSTEPTTTVAGNSISDIIVEVEDGSNSVITSNNSLITFSINTGPAGSGSLFVAVQAQSGTATLSGLSFTEAGTYTLAASTAGVTGANSTSFGITPDAPAQLVITQGPLSTTAGLTLRSVTVAVEDQWGNVVTNNTSNVAIAVSAGSGSLSGTATANASSGVATFSGLSITKADTYALSVTDSSLTAATTGSFTISPDVASKLAIVNGPSGITAGNSLSAITVAVEDQYNNIVTTDSSNITISKASGSGSLLGTATANAVAGVATFSGLTIQTAGNYTLGAAENGLTGATSGSFAVSPAAATHLVFTAQPGNTAAGALGSVAVTVEDQFNNVVTGDTSNVTLAINSVSTTLGGTATVAAISGVATFSNLSVTKTGSYTLSATDGGLTAGTSNSFTIAAGAASKLAITQDAATGVAGTTLSSIVVAVEDQYGNVVTGDSSNVTVALTGAGTLNGTKIIAASNGVATFSTLSLNQTGTYALNITDGVLAAATSSTFTVAPAAASKLVYTTGPSSTAAGALGTLVVSVEDAFNNVVTGDSSTVTLSVASGSGALLGTVSATAVNGVVTFSDLAIHTADSYTIHAGDGSLTGVTSSSFTISPAAANKLAFTSQPSSIVAGNLLTGINVSVEDQFGNVVTGSSAHVNFTVTGGGNTFHFVITASSGVAALTSLFLVKAGSYSVNAVSSGLTAANSNTITVDPAAPYQLVLTQDTSSATAGQTLSTLQASVEDQFGNVVIGDTSNVAIGVATGSGTLHGTATANAVAGVATFSNLSINTADAYTLQVTENGLVPATTASLTISPAAASQLVITTQPTNTVAGVTISNLVAKVEDQYGNVVTGDSSNVTVAIAGGSGTLLGTKTVAASSGVATFSTLKINLAGSVTLAVTDGLLSAATSSAFNITSAAADHVAFIISPSSSAAGALNTITVAVEDQFNNVVTTDSSNITLSVNSGAGSLLGTATANASAGVATFSALAIHTPSIETLKAHDGSLTDAISGSFTISPAAPSQLVITQDTNNATAGHTLSAIQVSVEDQFGNVVTSDSSNVTIAIASGTGTLFGTATANAASGVATFSNLKIDQAGNFTLRVTETGLTSATTASFGIVPDVASKLAITQQPNNATAGQAISTITVSVEDQFSNVVTTDSSNITIAIGTGSGTLNGTATANASSGVATFSGLSINQSGTVTLAASESGLTGASTNAFQITPDVATHLAITTQPASSGTVGTLSTIRVAVEDQFGNIVTSDSSSITAALQSGAGSLGGTKIIIANNGVATFSALTITKNGAFTINFTDTGLTNASTNSFTLNPDVASQLVFTQQPTDTVAGTLIPTVTVAVEDQYGNIVTTDASTVTLGINGSSSLRLIVPAVSGVATFSGAAINTAGTYKLRAIDGALTAGLSNSFNITPDVPAELAFISGPAGGSAGTLTSFQVGIEDQFGNLTTASTSVTLALISGTGSIAGFTTVAAVSGLATFSNVVLTSPGAHTISATDGGLTAATSSSFTMTPAAAAKLVVTQQTSDTVAGQTLAGLQVSVEDQFGNVVTADNSNVTIALGSGSGTLNGTKTAAASNGVATFNTLSLNTTGTYTLAAADGILTGATSSSFQITPGTAAKLLFTQGPTTTVAGQSIASMTVAVEDQFGNLVTGDGSNVTLSIATGTGTLHGTATANAVSGVATFAGLSINEAGTLTLRAADGNLTNGTTGSFAITPAAASHLVITQAPASGAAGALNAIAVSVEDQFGNVVTSDTSTITLSANNGPGDLLGTTSVAAANGVAMFNNLALHLGGTYTLSAADSGLTGATSGNFTIASAPASQLVFTQDTTDTTAGQHISALEVTVEDAFGNVVTTDASSITISIGSGTGPLLGTKTHNAVNGVATFSDLSLDQAGTVTLAATDSGLTGATSSAFAVTSAGANKLVITQGPTTTVAGQTISTVTVAVEDQFGNVVTDGESDVTLAIGGAGTLTGMTTETTSGGIATFADLSSTTAGTITLGASDRDLIGATSGSFTITPDVASQLVIVSGPANPATAGGTLANIVVHVEDQFGNLVTGDGSNVAVALDDESAVVTGNTTANAAGGVATISGLAIDTAGTYTITVSDGALDAATVDSFVVNPGAATKLVFDEEPGNGAPGTLGEVTVDVQDAFGNLVTTSNASITISTSGSGTLSGTKTVAADSGVAIFSNLSISKGGNYILTASSNGLTAGTSDPFSLGAKLVFVHQPGTTVAGQTIGGTLVVLVEDSSGHVITNDTSAVTIGIFSGPDGSTLDGTVTVNAVNGSASFTDLDITTAGSYKLVASDSGLPNSVSNAFTISPDVPDSLVIQQDTSNVTAGAKMSPVKVQVLDQFGNLATNSKTPVVLTITSGPNGGLITGTASVVPSNGLATFGALSFKKAGPYTLRAADGGVNHALTQFTVSPAAGKKLVFNQQPTNASSGTNISPAITVDIVDAFGNVANSTANVTLSLASGPSGATLSRTVAASAGEATFSTINFNHVGTTYKLKATASGLGNVTSAQFAITQPIGAIPAAFLAL